MLATATGMDKVQEEVSKQLASRKPLPLEDPHKLRTVHALWLFRDAVELLATEDGIKRLKTKFQDHHKRVATVAQSVEKGAHQASVFGPSSKRVLACSLVFLFLCLFVCLFFCLSVCLFVCLFVCSKLITCVPFVVLGEIIALARTLASYRQFVD
jgi:hypothetical protein